MHKQNTSPYIKKILETIEREDLSASIAVNTRYTQAMLYGSIAYGISTAMFLTALSPENTGGRLASLLLQLVTYLVIFSGLMLRYKSPTIPQSIVYIRRTAARLQRHADRLNRINYFLGLSLLANKYSDKISKADRSTLIAYFTNLNIIDQSVLNSQTFHSIAESLVILLHLFSLVTFVARFVRLNLSVVYFMYQFKTDAMRKMLAIKMWLMRTTVNCYRTNAVNFSSRTLKDHIIIHATSTSMQQQIYFQNLARRFEKNLMARDGQSLVLRAFSLITCLKLLCSSRYDRHRLNRLTSLKLEAQAGQIALNRRLEHCPDDKVAWVFSIQTNKPQYILNLRGYDNTRLAIEAIERTYGEFGDITCDKQVITLTPYTQKLDHLPTLSLPTMRAHASVAIDPASADALRGASEATKNVETIERKVRTGDKPQALSWVVDGNPIFFTPKPGEAQIVFQPRNPHGPQTWFVMLSAALRDKDSQPTIQHLVNSLPSRKITGAHGAGFKFCGREGITGERGGVCILKLKNTGDRELYGEIIAQNDTGILVELNTIRNHH